MRKVWLLAVIAILGVQAGCETPRWGFLDPEPKETSPLEGAQEVARVQEEIRNRKAPEALKLISGDPSGAASEGISDEVHQEWAELRRLLFGTSTLELKWSDEERDQRARFDRATGEVIFSGSPGEGGEDGFALAMAVNEAIEHQAFGAMGAVDSVDQWLSREIITQAGPLFVSTLHQAREAELEVSADELGKRPELSPWIPVVGERVKDEAFEVRPGAEHFEDALRRLIYREGLALGAALYRAGGWSGLEWGRIEPAASTNYAVRPDRWLRGDGEGRWEWPESYLEQREELGWSEVRSGSIGPAMTSIWLSSVVDPRAARTVYSGWLTDAYRVEERGEGSVKSLQWLSAWKSPHEAQEVAEAAERALAHYHGEEDREGRFQVLVQGVTVAVVVYNQAQDPELLSQEAQILSGARFGIVPEDPAPISFVPTLFEEYVEIAGEATLDEEFWRDDAAGWQAAVDSLRDWKLQKSDEAHVRWFGIHHDSTLVQWTTELMNPLQPEFGSPEYLEQMKAAFGATVRAREEPFAAVKEEPVNPTVEMEVTGLIDGRPLALRVWQWKRGDVLVSFSVQGPEESFGDRLTEVEAVLESLRTYGDAVGEGRRSRSNAGEDEGIIEFRIEEE